MKISEISAIDAHGHYGHYARPANPELVNDFCSATAAEVAARAARCGVSWTVVSPLSGLMPRGRTTDVFAGNEEAYREVPKVPGLLQYVIVNPLQPKTYDQALEMLKAPWCVGIKLHPEEHCYRIADEGEKLFEFLEKAAVPVMTHSGCPNSLPAAFVPFADRHPSVPLLLAHLGNGAGDNNRITNQVRAVQAAKHGNLWIDTSSARSLLPGVVEWAVKEIGAERLLFGSDTPLYHVAMQRTRIEAAEIPDEAKAIILRDNAIRFFRLEEKMPEKFGEPAAARG